MKFPRVLAQQVGEMPHGLIFCTSLPNNHTHQTLFCYAPVPFMQIKFVGVNDFLSCGIHPLYLDILQYCTVTLQIFYHAEFLLSTLIFYSIAQ